MNEEQNTTGIYDKDGEPWTPSVAGLIFAAVLFLLAMAGVVVTVWNVF